MNTSDIIKLTLDAGSVAGLFSFLYTVSEHRKKIAKFSFDFHGSASGNYETDNLEFARFRWEGTIRNESSVENSIVEIDYVVWADKSRTRAKTNGMVFSVEDANTKEKLAVPLNFKPKESRKITLVADVVLTGSHHNDLFNAKKLVKDGLPFLLPENKWDLLFTDVNHYMFDEKGILRSKKLIDLWWTLPNATKDLNNGNIFPTVREYVKIFFAWIAYRMARFLRFLGL